MQERHLATTSVLYTVELLEIILLSLPPESILTASRVCRRWNAVAASSLPVQRALFFSPVRNRGPLLKLTPPSTLPANYCESEDLPRALKPHINILLLKKFKLGHFDESDAEFDGGYMPTVSMRWLNELRKDSEQNPQAGKGDYNGGQPSWRQMFLTQPPARRVEIMIYETSRFPLVRAWVESEDGVTLGAIHDECENLIHGRGWERRCMGWFFEL